MMLEAYFITHPRPTVFEELDVGEAALSSLSVFRASGTSEVKSRTATRG